MRWQEWDGKKITYYFAVLHIFINQILQCDYIFLKWKKKE